MSQTRIASPELLLQVAEAAAAVSVGAMSDDAFKLTRLAVGAHRQRLNDGYMLRVRVPGGRISLEHWQAVAEVAADCASRGHLTLRQDIQLYHVALGSVAKAATALALRGVCTYASGGSTVRNVACGVLGDQDPAALFDPYPYAAALSARLSEHPLFNALPRKFKIGFAGPGPEEAQGWLNDLGFLPRLQDGASGFRLVAGGGLGASPQNAFEIEPFIRADQVGPYGEAALEYFASVSPKDKPMSNRFKFILREKGLETVRAEIARRLEGKKVDAPIAAPASAGGAVLWVETVVGDLSPAQMQRLGRLLSAAGAEGLRISFDQRLLVTGLRSESVAGLVQELAALGLHASPGRSPIRQVVCAGPDTCNRGLVNSKALGKELQGMELPVSLHISGCQNGCSQNLVAPLSLQGTVKSGPKGRQPHYQLRVGKPVDGSGLKFGSVLATLGARRVRPGLERLLTLWKNQGPDVAFELWLEQRGAAGLAEDLAPLSSPIGDDLTKDLGSDKVFEVALGGTECH